MNSSASVKIQTAFRLDAILLERLKRQAKSINRSLNSYVETILFNAAERELPRMPEGFEISEEIKELCGFIELETPTREELEKDPKLERIWHKYLTE